MPKGYWIARVDVADMDKYKLYVAANAKPARGVWREVPGAIRALRSC